MPSTNIFTQCGGGAAATQKNAKAVRAQLTDILHALAITPKFKTTGVTLMVMGVPNVGKSSFINAMSSGVHGTGKKAKTGPLPAVTRHVRAVKVTDNPVAFLLDTPGIMVPKVASCEQGLKLALTGSIRDMVVGEHLLADYLLYR